MIEVTRIERWLYETLVADPVLAGLGVYSRLAPPEASLPFVLFAFQSAETDLAVIGGRRIVVSPLYQVKVIGEGPSLAALAPYADRIDAAIQARSGAALDGTVLVCLREQPLLFQEEDNGTVYIHLGGLYRIRYSPSGV